MPQVTQERQSQKWKPGFPESQPRVLSPKAQSNISLSVHHSHCVRFTTPQQKAEGAVQPPSTSAAS